MITILDRYLPPELSDKIYKMHHKSIMEKVCEIINFKTVFIICKKGDQRCLSFLVCENQNYYTCLSSIQQ